MRMKPRPRTVLLTALLSATIAGLGVASAQLVTNPARAVGAPADDYPEGEACASGIAIDVTAGNVCSDFCSEDSDCPTDWGCRQVHQGNGEKVGLCFPYRNVANP